MHQLIIYFVFLIYLFDFINIVISIIDSVFDCRAFVVDVGLVGIELIFGFARLFFCVVRIIRIVLCIRVIFIGFLLISSLRLIRLLINRSIDVIFQAVFLIIPFTYTKPPIPSFFPLPTH